MKGRELERILALAAELVETRAQLDRAVQLELEIEQQGEIERLAPRTTRVVAGHRCQVERVARSLEEQWVAQGPLIALWQRAVELADQAECAGADPAPFQADVDEARRRVESARLETREDLDRLIEQRAALLDVVVSAPIELPLPDAVKDDGRPEAARREALALSACAGRAEQLLERAHADAVRAMTEARTELRDVGGADAASARVQELEAQLPRHVKLPDSAPPSAALRLRRAGVSVEATAGV